MPGCGLQCLVMRHTIHLCLCCSKVMQPRRGNDSGGLNCLYCWVSPQPQLKLQKLENLIQRAVITFKAEGYVQLHSARVWIQYNSVLWTDAYCPCWWHQAGRNDQCFRGHGLELKMISVNWKLDLEEHCVFPLRQRAKYCMQADITSLTSREKGTNVK